MTSDAQKGNGYAIPDPIDGYSSFVCYQIYVPDVEEYRLAFEAQVQGLDRWWMWHKDGDKTERRAARAARYWYNLTKDLTANNCEGDMFDIRQKPDAPCIIQKTFNAGGLWIDAINMQLCPPRVRTNQGVTQWYNPETGEWEPTEGGDEREDGTAEIPWPIPPEGEDGACLSAENITSVYQTTLTQIRAGVEVSQAATLLAATVTGIAGVFISPMIYSTVALAITYAALSLGVEGLNTMLDQEHLDNFKCVVYLNAESDGSITSAGFTAIRAGMAGWASGLELALIQYYLDGYGSVGLQRQGRAGGITEGHCDDCEPVTDPFVWYVPASLAVGSYWGADTDPAWYPAAPSDVNVPSGEGSFASLGSMVGMWEVLPTRGTIPDYGSGTSYGTLVVACNPIAPEDKPTEGALDIQYETTSDGSQGINGLIRVAMLVGGSWTVIDQRANGASVASGVQHITIDLTALGSTAWTAMSVYISGYQVTKLTNIIYIPPI